MSIKRLHPGPRMSQAVIHGDTVYLAGQVGNPGSGMAEQAQEALAAVDSLLAEAGSSKSKILSVTVWLADMGDFAAMNAVYAEFFTEGQYPARSAVEVGALPRGALVEIETICVK